jgi:WD40 repeat protein
LSFLGGGLGAFPVIVSPRSAVAAVSADGGLGSVKLWDLNGREELRTIGSDGDRPAFFSADGQLIATVNNSIVTFWRVSDGARVERFAIEVEGYVHFSPSYGLALSPDGSTIAGRVTHDRISLISTTSKREVGRLALPTDPGLKVAPADGSLLFKFDGPTGRALFSPVDDLLAIPEPNGIGLYRMSASRPEQERIPMVRERSGYLSPYSYSPDAIAFSADGAVLATSDAGAVRLWCWP